jgi:hypothetical protein
MPSSGVPLMADLYQQAEAAYMATDPKDLPIRMSATDQWRGFKAGYRARAAEDENALSGAHKLLTAAGKLLDYVQHKPGCGWERTAGRVQRTAQDCSCGLDALREKQGVEL